MQKTNGFHNASFIFAIHNIPANTFVRPSNTANPSAPSRMGGGQETRGCLPMPFAARPTPLLSAAPCSPSERRERSPLHAPVGLDRVPTFERDAQAHPPGASHRPAPLSAEPMGQIIDMAATGLWVVKRRGVLIEIDGCNHWSSPSAATAAATAHGVPLSDIVIHTGA